MPVLDLSPLRNAIAQLRAGLETLDRDPGNALYRDGVIQRFEVTYTLCHRMLLRFLEATAVSVDEVDQMSFASIIRRGSERGLLRSGWDEWRRFREARNATSQTYNQSTAEQVLATIPDFLVEAESFYEQLEQRSH